MTDHTHWAAQLSSTIADATRRILALHPETTGTPTADLDRLISHESEHAIVSTSVQTWSSTAGPYDGIAGQMVTATRIVRVIVGVHAAVYSNGEFLYLLDGGRLEHRDGFHDYHVPSVTAVGRWWEQPAV